MRGTAPNSRPRARAAAHLNTVHTEMTAQAADFSQALDAMPELFDEPFGDSAAWSNYLIAQFARREVTVALSGEGGDEIFCGYPRYWSRIGARSNVLNRSLARCCRRCRASPPPCSATRMSGLPAFAAALGGMTAVRSTACSPFLARAGLRLSVVLPAVLARGFKSAGAAALVGSQHGSRRGFADQGRPHQHGAFARSAAAAARSSPGRVHAERGPRAAGRPAPAARQIAGAPAHGAAIAARALGSAEVRLRAAGASLAQAPSALPAGGGGAAHGARRAQAPVGSEFRRAWSLLVLDRWFTAFD